MAFRARAIANNRFEIVDEGRKDLMALALGRRNADLIIEALETRFGSGEQLELPDEVAA